MEKDNNKIFELHNYLDVNGSPEDVVKEIVKNIPELEDIGFAGCLEKDFLKKILKGFVFGKEGKNQSYLYSFENEKNVRKICWEVIEKCKLYINKKVHIFLFPTYDNFVIEKMGGVNGFSTWNNTLLIFINFRDNWEASLKEAIVHELAHALSPFYKGGDFSVGSGLVLDGLAEHFKYFVLSVKRSPWTQAISEKKAWEIFKELKNILEVKDFDKYNEVFYGTGRYPMWAGYTIGYYLIEDYLKNKKNIDWKKLLREDPMKILNEIISSKRLNTPLS